MSNKRAMPSPLLFAVIFAVGLAVLLAGGKLGRSGPNCQHTYRTTLEIHGVAGRWPTVDEIRRQTTRLLYKDAVLQQAATEVCLGQPPLSASEKAAFKKHLQINVSKDSRRGQRVVELCWSGNLPHGAQLVESLGRQFVAQHAFERQAEEHCTAVVNEISQAQTRAVRLADEVDRTATQIASLQQALRQGRRQAVTARYASFTAVSPDSSAQEMLYQGRRTVGMDLGRLLELQSRQLAEISRLRKHIKKLTVEQAAAEDLATAMVSATWWILPAESQTIGLRAGDWAVGLLLAMAAICGVWKLARRRSDDRSFRTACEAQRVVGLPMLAVAC